MLQSFKKYPKSWLLLVTVLFIGIIAVMGGHFSDAATKPFWWNFWIVVQVLAIVLILAGWCFAWFGQKRKQ